MFHLLRDSYVLDQQELCLLFVVNSELMMFHFPEDENVEVILMN